jgi:hypothetical protein
MASGAGSGAGPGAGDVRSVPSKDVGVPTTRRVGGTGGLGTSGTREAAWGSGIRVARDAGNVPNNYVGVPTTRIVGGTGGLGTTGMRVGANSRDVPNKNVGASTTRRAGGAEEVGTVCTLDVGALGAARGTGLLEAALGAVTNIHHSESESGVEGELRSIPQRLSHDTRRGSDGNPYVGLDVPPGGEDLSTWNCHHKSGLPQEGSRKTAVGRNWLS